MMAQAWRIARKDLREEWRSKESLNAAVAFAILVLLLFSFAFDPAADETRQYAGGILWLVFTFAAVLILNRTFAKERTNDCLEALLVSPVAASAIFLGKAIASFVLVLAVEAICLPAFAIFYNAQLTAGWTTLAAVIPLATWGMAVVGTVFSALTVNLHLRELMLPMLIYPMLLPAIVGAIELTRVALEGRPPTADEWFWFRLLIGFDIIFTSLALLLIEVVLVD